METQEKERWPTSIQLFKRCYKSWLSLIQMHNESKLIQQHYIWLIDVDEYDN